MKTLARLLLAALPWVGGLAPFVGLAAWRMLDVRHQRALGAKEAEARNLRQHIGTLEANLGRARALAARQRDSVHTVYVPRWLRAKAVVETLPPEVDTVPVPVEVVREIVAAADTALNACASALRNCAVIEAQFDSVVAAQRQLERLAPKPEAAWRRWGKYALAFVAGAALARAP